MKRVIFMAEGMGMYVKGFKNKSESVKAMRLEAETEEMLDMLEWGDYYKFSPKDITEDTVKETRYRQHRYCETETVGDDDICYECGEPCGTSGRMTFAYFAI
jgi:hypothetical protein